MDLINLYELNDDIVINKGDIIKTVPEVLKNEGLSFSLAFCDTDLYEPSVVILENIHPRLSIGGLFIFDEWNAERWAGESVAVREFMEKHGDSYEMISIRTARQPSLALRKIAS